MTRIARRRRRRVFGAGAAALALLAALILAVGLAGGAPRASANPTGASPVVYVTGQGVNGAATVEALSLAGITVGGAAATPVGNVPTIASLGPMAVNDTATQALVGYNVDSANPFQAEVIDVANGADAGTVALAFQPVGIAMDPVNPELAFVVETSFNEGGQIQRVDMGVSPPTVTTVASSLGGVLTPTAIVISPDGKTLYVSGGNSDIRTIGAFPVSGAGPTLWRAIDGGPAADLAIAPNGSRIFAVGPSEVFFLNLPLTSTEKAVTRGNIVPSAPRAVTVGPNGQTVYVGGANGFGQPAEVAAFTTATLGPAGGPVAVQMVPNANNAGGLEGIAVSPNGATLVAYGVTTNPNGLSSGVMYPISLPNLTVESADTSPGFTSTSGPEDIAMTPDQAPHAAFAVSAGPAGHPSTFVAGGSVAYGSVTRFVWNFGDGVTATTGGSSINHTYAAAGSYHATLTEVDSAGTSIPPAVPGTGFFVNGPGQTPYSRASALARTTQIIAVSATPPTTGSTSTTATTTVITPSQTTTSTTTRHGSTTTTTVPGHHVSGAPTLVLNPAVGPPGAIVTVTGSGFRPNIAVTVSWSVSSGSVIITPNAQGKLPPTAMYILTPDLLGPRFADASSTPPATAPFLVVPSTSEPGGDSGGLLFRSEGP